jgi:threonine dehydrogenase-like Zn-dependent dehydrogenase
MMGNEFMGVVRKVDPSVKTIKTGDRATVP